MLVIKFGGSSVGSLSALRSVERIISELASHEDKLVVVVSAFQGVTDQLLFLGKTASEGQKQYLDALQRLQARHQEVIDNLLSSTKSEMLGTCHFLFSELGQILHGCYLIKEVSPKTLDYIASFGERLSAMILTALLKEHSSQVSYLDSREVILTDKEFGYAKVDLDKSYPQISKAIEQSKKITITTGFIGATKEGATTTLGRGGSDYTAALFAAALDAYELQIWTDVDGVMTSDPRKVPQAFMIPSLSYEEAMELSHFGAKVIYPPTMHPVFAKKIPLWIKNTFNPSCKGTLIAQHTESTKGLIKGISSIDRVSLIRIQGSNMIGIAGSSMRVFGALARHKVNVILISQASSEHSICIAVMPKDAPLAKECIEDEFKYEIQAQQMDLVQIEPNLSIIAIVGEKMRQTSGVSSRLFSSLGNNGINVVAIAQGSSELNISVVIRKQDEEKALKTIHEAFFLSQNKTAHLFLVGVGGIGKTLLKQLMLQKEKIKQEMSIDIRLVGVMNSKSMYFDDKGICLDHVEETLSREGKAAHLRSFVTKMQDYNLPCSIFIDATASDETVKFYEEIFHTNISIATPNKKGNSSSYEQYITFKESARERGVIFAYETNVGAGLPVLSTLKDLLQSGDKILKIEAILSGTLSYIFNELSLEKKLSSIVKQARALGYTEPDPREDLSGLDAARKLLILIRDSGFSYEMSQIDLKGVLSDVPYEKTTQEFLDWLPTQDSIFREKVEKAHKENKKLRYVASFDGKLAKVSLTTIDQHHPFYHLHGSDNMIVFTTSRYQQTPLVIRGPGAGAEVTAAGLFADIMKCIALDGKLVPSSYRRES